MEKERKKNEFRERERARETPKDPKGEKEKGTKMTPWREEKKNKLNSFENDKNDPFGDEVSERRKTRVFGTKSEGRENKIIWRERVRQQNDS